MFNGFHRFSVILMVLFCLFSNATEAEDIWQLDTLFRTRTFTQMGPDSCALDAAGNPAVAYGGSGLFFAHYDGSSWRKETVDDSCAVGRYTCLKFDAQGDAHVVYSDWDIAWTNYHIKYAHQEQGVWHVESVPANSDEITDFSMDLDSSGRPWIAMTDNNGVTLKLIYLDSSDTWTQQQIFASIERLYTPEIAMHGNSPRIAYLAGNTDPDLHLVYSNGTGFSTMLIDSDTVNVSDLDLEVSSADDVHLCYSSETDSALKYATVQIGGSWPVVNYIVDNSGERNGINPAIALHPITGVPSISYTNRLQTGSELKLAEFNGTAFTTSTLIQSDDRKSHSSIQQDSSESYHVTFLNEDEEVLQYTSVISGTPQTKILDGMQKYRDPVHVTSNPAGDIFVVYYDIFTENYAYMYKQSWQYIKSLIPELSSSMSKFNVSMNPQGHMGVTWIGSSQPSLSTGYLNYSEQTDTGWNHETIDPALCALDIETELQITPSGDVHVLYDASTLSMIRHAWRHNNQWHISDIYDGWVKYYHMDLGPGGSVHIIFQDTNNNLHYTYSSDKTHWTDEIILTNVTNEGESLIQADSRDVPHILHMDPDNNAILHFQIYQWHWISEVIPGIEWYDDIIWAYNISSTDCHEIVFWNNVTLNLHCLSKDEDATNWSSEILDDRALVVTDLSLTEDPMGRLDIVYFDNLSGSIIHAKKRKPIWYDMSMPATRMLPGTQFRLYREICNTTHTDQVFDEYIILDVYGGLWFAPDWTETPDFLVTSVPAETSDQISVFSFPWPDIDSIASGIRFWGGTVYTGTAEIVDYDLATFEWDR